MTLTVFFFGMEYSRKTLEVRRLRKQLKDFEPTYSPSSRTAIAENTDSDHGLTREPTKMSDPLT